jgi:hypothetical protein
MIASSIWHKSRKAQAEIKGSFGVWRHVSLVHLQYPEAPYSAPSPSAILNSFPRTTIRLDHGVTGDL